MTKSVSIRRVLRDGSVTRENGLPEWLAEQIIGAISECEPNVASAQIIRDAPAQLSRFTYRQDGYGLALAMAGQLPGGLILH